LIEHNDINEWRAENGPGISSHSWAKRLYFLHFSGLFFSKSFHSTAAKTKNERHVRGEDEDEDEDDADVVEDEDEDDADVVEDEDEDDADVVEEHVLLLSFFLSTPLFISLLLSPLGFSLFSRCFLHFSFARYLLSFG
jgi:hypothetical protein